MASPTSLMTAIPVLGVESSTSRMRSCNRGHGSLLPGSVVAAMSVAIGGLIAASLIALDLPAAGSINYGLGWTMVGLVFAAIGRTLGVIDDAIFSGIVLMVIVTTLIAPPWLGRAVELQIARERAERTSSSTR